MNTIFTTKSLTNSESIAQVKKIDLDQLPVRVIDFSNSNDVAKHDQMVELVERMLHLSERLDEARTEWDLTDIWSQIRVTDQRIDWLVYELYDLEDEEIKLVEGKAE